MQFKTSAVLLLAVICTLCTQSAFAYVSVITGTIKNGYAAIQFIKDHLPGDNNKKLEKVSVTDNGPCTIIVQKLSGKNIWVNYHVDDGRAFDLIYAAANNGHTYGKMIETLTDTMKSEGNGNWQFQIAGVTERVTTRSMGCADGRTKWVAKYGEYDYHVALSKDGHCWKNFGALAQGSNKLNAEIDAWNDKYNPC